MKPVKNFFSVVTFFCILTLSSLNILAQEEKEFQITSVDQLQDINYAEEIEEFYNSGREGYFFGEENVKIYYRKFKNEGGKNGGIVLSTGRTEAAIKYKEVIFDLYRNGYSVYILDHRGQGQSGRMNEDLQIGHVDDFQNYIDDLKTFYDEQVKPDEPGNIYMLSHSMGGAISMAYLEQFPEDFTAASFCSPMLRFSAYICPLAKILSGKKVKYAPGQGRYNENRTFEENDVTGCKVRFMRSFNATAEVPETKLGGVSVQWLEESCKEFKLIFKNVNNINIPFIIFSAEDETVVNPKGHTKFIDKAQTKGKDCELYFVKDAQHEILMEKDVQRKYILETSLRFFEEN